jgi:hypothetical protein
MIYEEKVYTVMVNNFTDINKTSESAHVVLLFVYICFVVGDSVIKRRSFGILSICLILPHV